MSADDTPQLPKPSDKEIEIAVLTREKEKLEESIKKLFSLKKLVVAALIGIVVGGFIGWFVNYQDRSITYRYNLLDSLETRKVPHFYQESFLNDKRIEPYQYFDSANLRKDSIDRIEYAGKTDSLKLVAGMVEGNVNKDLNRGTLNAVLAGMGYGFLMIILYYVIIGAIIAGWVKSRVRTLKVKLLEAGAKELKENIEKDFFTKLVEINFKYLDQYYLQTQEQAEKSFLLAAFASVTGFLLIIAGIIIMYQKNQQPGYVATSAGVISEFIAAVFFYLYNRTVLKMSQYHQKLVITQNISLALKTADLLQDSKEKVLETLIDRLTLDVNKYLTGGQQD